MLGLQKQNSNELGMRWTGHMVIMKLERIPKRADTREQEGCNEDTNDLSESVMEIAVSM